MNFEATTTTLTEVSRTLYTLGGPREFGVMKMGGPREFGVMKMGGPREFGVMKMGGPREFGVMTPTLWKAA